jgi:hypothetical protein
MPTAEYVPRGLGVPYIGTIGTIDGGDTALDTPDDDATYVQMDDSGGDTRVGFAIDHWEWVAGDVPPVDVEFNLLTLEARWRVGPAATPGQICGWGFAVNGYTRFVTSADYGTSWQDESAIAADRASDGLQALACDAFPDGGFPPWSLYALEPSTLNTMSARITYLRMVAEWGDVASSERPHQIFQRGDALGAGGGLVFNPGTRQSSGLVFGTH